MTLQLFTPRGPDNEITRVPNAYRRSVRWLPQLGDVFPDFAVDTTQGKLNLYDWADGAWVVLFSHPAAMTPVCTTELASFASLKSDWEANNIKLLGLTGSPIDEQLEWHADIERIFGLTIDFPTAHDPRGQLAKLFGMIHTHESTDWPIRKTFILNPVLQVGMILEYPVFVGRSSEEILRVVRALQVRAETGAATPADWYEGDILLLPDDISDSEARRIFSTDPVRLAPYLRVVDTGETQPHFMPRVVGMK